MNLPASVLSDMDALFEQSRELCSDERDLRVHLALRLRGSARQYDDVEGEYYLPLASPGSQYVRINDESRWLNPQEGGVELHRTLITITRQWQ